jgi:hypothetical protein
MNMMRGFSNIFGASSAGASLGNYSMSSGSSGGSGGLGLQMRANGGTVSGNSPYMVGERGPELFVPNMSGAVIPNNSLSSSMSGGQTVNYNGPYIANMSAIDTQTGVQFLAKNKQTIWASYQSANRSVPVSR